jgi:hypothetical protein
MKLYILIFLLVITAIKACHQKSVKTESNHSVNNDNVRTELLIVKADSVNSENIRRDSIRESISGDYNGDGKKETVWLDSPNKKELVEWYDYEKEDGKAVSESHLRFSNPQIPSIKIEHCIGGKPVNEGDLNGDGANEIGILPEWYIGNWYFYHVYTLHRGKWIMAVDPIPVYRSDYHESGFDVIKTNPQKPGYVIINYSAVNDTFYVATKSVKIK